MWTLNLTEVIRGHITELGDTRGSSLEVAVTERVVSDITVVCKVTGLTYRITPLVLFFQVK